MFEITVEQKTLMAALNMLAPTVGKNTQNLGDNCISMESTTNGTVMMYTTNTIEFAALELVVGSSNNQQAKAPYVDFKRFANIIKTIPPNDYITIKTDGVNDIMIEFQLKKQPVKLMGCNNGMIALPTGQQYGQVVDVPTDFINVSLKYATSIINDNDSTPIYNCIRIATDNNDIEISGLDTQTKRMFVKNTQISYTNPQEQVVIEASKFAKSMRLFENYYDVSFESSPGVIHVTGTTLNNNPKYPDIIGAEYYARVISGVYPVNIGSTLNSGVNEFSEINKKELLDSIARARAIEDTTTGQKAVQLDITGNTVRLSTSSAYGALEDEITAENSITINSQVHSLFKYEHLADIISVIPTDTVEIGSLSQHPGHFVLRPTGISDTCFSIAELVANSTP